MPRVRVKVPKEPKIIEMPQMNTSAGLPAAPVVEAPQPQYEPPVEMIEQPVVTALEPIVLAPEPAMPPQTYVPSTAAPKAVTLSFKALAFGGVAVIIVVLFAIGITRAKTGDNSNQTLGATTTAEQSEAKQYYDIVSKYVELPTDELPTVANVSEADKVREQNAVLNDVKDGDKMLFFAKSRKVIVYRPSSHKVVAVVSLAQPTPAATTAPTTTKKTQ